MDIFDKRLECLRLASNLNDPVRIVEAAKHFMDFIVTGEAPKDLQSAVDKASRAYDEKVKENQRFALGPMFPSI